MVNKSIKQLTFLTSFSWWKMYSNRALARFGLAAYLLKFSRARLMNGPSGVDSIDAWKKQKQKLSVFVNKIIKYFFKFIFCHKNILWDCRYMNKLELPHCESNEYSKRAGKAFKFSLVRDIVFSVIYLGNSQKNVLILQQKHSSCQVGEWNCPALHVQSIHVHGVIRKYLIWIPMFFYRALQLSHCEAKCGH